MKNNTVKINPTAYNAIIEVTGTFEYKPGHDEVRQYTEVYNFDHDPSTQEVMDAFKENQPGIISRSDWSDVKIVGYTIVEPIKPINITIKK